MKNSKNFFIIACFFQWISCCYYNYENGPVYRQFHGPFVNQQKPFYQPDIKEIKTVPLINLNLEQNYGNQSIDFKTLFQDHTHSKINYSFEITPIKAPACFYAMIDENQAKNTTHTSNNFSSDTAKHLFCKKSCPLKKRIYN